MVFLFLFTGAAINSYIPLDIPNVNDNGMEIELHLQLRVIGRTKESSFLFMRKATQDVPDIQ